MQTKTDVEMSNSGLFELVALSKEAGERPGDNQSGERDEEEFDTEANQTSGMQRAGLLDESQAPGSHRSLLAAEVEQSDQRSRSFESQWLARMEEDRKAFLEALRENTLSLMTGPRSADTGSRALMGREMKRRGENVQTKTDVEMSNSGLFELVALSKEAGERPGDNQSGERDEEEFDTEANQTSGMQRAGLLDESQAPGSHRSLLAAEVEQSDQRSRSFESQWLARMEEDRKAFLEALRENTLSLMTGPRSADTGSRALMGREMKRRGENVQTKTDVEMSNSGLFELVALSKEAGERPGDNQSGERDEEEFDTEANQTSGMQRAGLLDESQAPGSRRSLLAAEVEQSDQRSRSFESQWLARMEEDRKAFLEALRENTLSLMTGPRSADTGSRALMGREPKFRKLEEGDDVEHYLAAFERFATTYELKREVWAQKLAPLLSGKVQAAYANMDVEKIGEYGELKAILRRYDINEETYRQRFRSCRKSSEESYAELGIKLKDLFGKWMQPSVKTKEEVCDLMVLEQLLDGMPNDLKVWLKERKPKSLSEAAEMADNYVAARRDGREKRTCTNCGKVGHIAKFCRLVEGDKTKTATGVATSKGGTEEPGNQSKPGGVAKEKGITCFSCRELGHYASKCPQRSKGDGKFRGSGKLSGYARAVQEQEKELQGEPAAEDSRESTTGSSATTFHIPGVVEGRNVPVLVDTGCSYTLVRDDLVDPGKLDPEATVRVRCCHGDTRTYPTADVQVTIDGVDHHVRAGVLPDLLQPILLGHDVGVLPQLVQKEVDACLVVTRGGEQKAKAQRMQDEVGDRKSGAYTNRLEGENNPVQEEFQEMAEGLDQNLFQGGHKGRKSRMQRRAAKRVWKLFAGQKIDSEGSDCMDQVTEGCCPETESDDYVSESCLEAGSGDEGKGSDPEGDVGSGRDVSEDPAISIVSTQELKRLQREDPTLEKIRDQLQKDQDEGRSGGFFWRADLLYRRWIPCRGTGEEDSHIDQIVLPVQCRSTVLRLAMTCLLLDT